MTDETEAVALSPSAKAVNDLLIDLFPHWDWDQRECIASLAAREAITALDRHRIEHAGEVEKRLASLERDLLPYKDRPLGSVRIDLDEVRAICGAATTIASMRAEIERAKLDGVRAGEPYATKADSDGDDGA